MRRLAAVDVGSTSVHLLAADVSGGRVAAVLDESAFLGLGAAVEMRGLLGAPVAGELVALLAVYASRAHDVGAADVLAMGTAPLRRAPDAARIVRRVERDLGLPLAVLTAREEALLTLVGVTGGAPPTGELVVVDVGGGSTEVVIGRPGGPVAVEALDVGAATLAGRHVAADPPTREELAAMAAEARALATTLSAARPRAAVAVGGTADNLARVIHDGSNAGVPPDRLTRSALVAAVGALGALTADEAAARYGIRPARARLLPAGATILLVLLDRWGLDDVRVARAGLREGAVLALSLAGVGWRDRLEGLAAGRPA